MKARLPSHIDPKHCLITKKYAVFTPPIYEMVETVASWIEQRFPGGYIYGPSRVGKTRCITWFLKSMLTEQFGGPVPLVVWSHRIDLHTSEAYFWTAILESSDFFFSEKKTPTRKVELFKLVIYRFIALAEHSGGNYVVLLIDEAQDLTEREWKWLVGLQNALELQNFSLSIISVGSHQMNYQHSALIAAGDAHITNRFLSASAPFRGIASEEELAYVLNGYDEDSRWPVDSSISYLASFSPNNYDAGFRLTQHAADFWFALNNECDESLKKRDKEFPMQHIARTIESLLMELAYGASWEDVTSAENIATHVKRTGLREYMRIISMYKSDETRHRR